MVTHLTRLPISPAWPQTTWTRGIPPSTINGLTPSTLSIRRRGTRDTWTLSPTTRSPWEWFDDDDDDDDDDDGGGGDGGGGGGDDDD